MTVRKYCENFKQWEHINEKPLQAKGNYFAYLY